MARATPLWGSVRGRHAARDLSPPRVTGFVLSPTVQGTPADDRGHLVRTETSPRRTGRSKALLLFVLLVFLLHTANRFRYVFQRITERTASRVRSDHHTFRRTRIYITRAVVVRPGASIGGSFGGRSNSVGWPVDMGGPGDGLTRENVYTRIKSGRKKSFS